MQSNNKLELPEAIAEGNSYASFVLSKLPKLVLERMKETARKKLKLSLTRKKTFFFIPKNLSTGFF